AFCASLVAYLNKIPLAHIESGLRTGDKWRPFPEEMFRQFNDLSADILFVPTESARQNLIEEGYKQEIIYNTGNTAIDALERASSLTTNPDYNPGEKLLEIVDSINAQNRIPCVLTIHRRETQGPYFREILEKLKDYANDCRLSYIFPVHPAPWIREQLKEFQSPYIEKLPSVSYLQFVWLMNNSKLVFSDSGGIQEEGPHLGIPVIVLRKETERPEAITEGNNFFISQTTPALIRKLLSQQVNKSTLYGDGEASMKILSHLESFLDQRNIKD
ncbi:MAG: UDP-N-acetyl glucosamine 2-epimerase, partial [Bacteroidia bacterium]|nr:UDP-N-acetyl glucosamine 2-epimerase [Bacteroidia bacterium]